MTIKPSPTSLLIATPLLASMLIAVAPYAGPAQAASSPPRQCFLARSVTSFKAADRENVYVRVGVKDVYAFKLLGPCPDVDWTLQVALVSRGSDFICSGLDAELVVPSPIGPQRCPVQDVRKLTPEEVAALPKKLLP